MKQESVNFYWMVGNRIRDIRIYERIRVESLANACGISAKYLYQIENGKVAFSTEILFQLASKLEVSADVLLGLKKQERE